MVLRVDIINYDLDSNSSTAHILLNSPDPYFRSSGTWYKHLNLLDVVSVSGTRSLCRGSVVLAGVITQECVPQILSETPGAITTSYPTSCYVERVLVNGADLVTKERDSPVPHHACYWAVKIPRAVLEGGNKLTCVSGISP